MEQVKKSQPISLAEVKDILGKEDVEKMDQIQRWTYDYVTKFTKVDAKAAKKIKHELKKECGLTDEEATEIVNIMPSSLAELRAFTFGWKKLILAETLEKILHILKGNS